VHSHGEIAIRRGTPEYRVNSVNIDVCKRLSMNGSNENGHGGTFLASVNASIEQRGEQRFQPHVERLVERLVS